MANINTIQVGSTSYTAGFAWEALGVLQAQTSKAYSFAYAAIVAVVPSNHGMYANRTVTTATSCTEYFVWEEMGSVQILMGFYACPSGTFTVTYSLGSATSASPSATVYYLCGV